MSFEFLAPDAAAIFEGVAPTLRSPIEWAHRDAGAELGELSGWSVVTGYGAARREATACRRTVGVADLAHLGKLELQGPVASVAAIVASHAGGAKLEARVATEVGPAMADADEDATHVEANEANSVLCHWTSA